MVGNTAPAPRRDQDLDGRRRPPVTTVQRAIVFGALFALLMAATASLATARVTDRQSEVDELSTQAREMRAEIALLNGQIDDQGAEIARLTGQAADGTAEDGSAADGSAEADRIDAELTALEERASAAEARVEVLEAEKASLEEQLALALNPPAGPAPTASIAIHWIWNGAASGTRIACITIENTSDTDANLRYSYSSFSAIDAENFSYSSRQPSRIQLERALADGELRPGERASGELGFEITEQATAFTTLVWNTGHAATPEIVVDAPAARGGQYVGSTDFEC